MSRISILILLVIFPLFALPLSAQIPVNDAPYYDVFADFNFKSGTVEVFMVWKLSKQPGENRVDFEISPLATVSYIDLRVTDQIYTTVNQGFYGREQVSVKIPSMFEETIASTELTLELRYRYPFNIGEDGSVLLTKDDLWYPFTGDEKPTFKIRTDLPSQYLVYSNGEMKERKNTQDAVQHTFVSKTATDQMVLFCALFGRPVDNVTSEILSNSGIELPIENGSELVGVEE